VQPVDSDAGRTPVLADGAFAYPPADRRATEHDAAVSEIVGMIRAKYEDQGERNLAIGKRAYEHAQWQRGNFPGYTAADFDTLMRRIREDVQAYVPIKAESIRVDDWVRCHVLRSLVADAIGEDAAKLVSFFEYRTLTGKALAFSKKDVEGSLNAGWLDMVRELVARRLTAGRNAVNTEAFKGMVEATVERLKALDESSADPMALAAKAARDAARAVARAKARAVEAITVSVSDALAGECLTAEGVLAIVEGVAKHYNVTLPAKFGFDPVTCTAADCHLLAASMLQAGKFAEMVRLRDRLDRLVAAGRAPASAAGPGANPPHAA